MLRSLLKAVPPYELNPASCRAVNPSSFSISLSAPFSSSLMTASCPFFVAHDSGVWLYLFFESSVAPFSSSSLATASCLLSAAHDSGVQLFLSFESSAAPFSSSSLTTASCPLYATYNSGVWSYLFFESSAREKRKKRRRKPEGQVYIYTYEVMWPSHRGSKG